MPYFLSKEISTDIPPLWKEGAPYQRSSIYDGCSPSASADVPPVHYDGHLFRPHSICHADAQAHIQHGGKTIDQYFDPTSNASPLWGPAAVVRFDGAGFKECDVSGSKELMLLRIGRSELEDAVFRVTGKAHPPSRLLITAKGVPNCDHYGHDPRWAIVLDEDAARWLVDGGNFLLYGTSWKSTDYMPGSRERPIHRIILNTALIFECLDLAEVPEGVYFWVSGALRLVGASESPACPMLFTKEELGW